MADPHWIVVGAGSIGRRHIRNLLGLGRSVVAVRTGGRSLDAELSEVAVAASIAEARGEGPAVAIICTPTALHVDNALAAARLGCHVLIEKPLSDRLEGIEALESELRTRALVGGVAHNLRFHPALRAIHDEIKRGAIGRPLTVSVWCGQHLADWRPGRDHRQTYSASRAMGGGVVFDLIHEIDYLHWFFGDVTRVWAALSNSGSLGIDTEDNADIVLRFESGLPAACHLDYLARPASRGGALTAAEGSLRWNLISPYRVDRWDASGAGHTLRSDDRWPANDMYVEELLAFESAVRGERGAETTIADAARSVRTALAIHRSAESGEVVA